MVPFHLFNVGAALIRGHATYDICSVELATNEAHEVCMVTMLFNNFLVHMEPLKTRWCTTVGPEACGKPPQPIQRLTPLSINDEGVKLCKMSLYLVRAAFLFWH